MNHRRRNVQSTTQPKLRATFLFATLTTGLGLTMGAMSTQVAYAAQGNNNVQAEQLAVFDQALNTVTQREVLSSEKSGDKEVSQEIKQHLRETLQKAGMKQPIASIELSKLPSMYQVTLAGMGAQPLHMTADGKYVLQGVLHPNPSSRVSTPPNEPAHIAKSGMPVSQTLKATILNNTKKLKNITSDVQLYYTSLPGIIWGITLKGQPFITTTDASVFTSGEISVIKNGRFAGLDSAFEKQKNKHIFSQLDEKQLIEYPATTHERATVYVATDVNCPYCRVLHKELANINAQGITVKVIGFPTYEESPEQMRQIWCEKDDKARKKALDVAMNGILQKGKSKCSSNNDNPLYANQVLASGLAVYATPAIYREDGVMYDRAYDEKSLLAFLGLNPL